MKKLMGDGSFVEMQPFDDAPDDFAFFIRENWLPRIRTDEAVAPEHRIPPFHTRGSSLVPRLEYEAIKALAEVFPALPQQPDVDTMARTTTVDAPAAAPRFRRQAAPAIPDTYEDAFVRWRDLWARQAYLHVGTPKGKSRKQTAALNILNAASELRAAIDAGAAEKAAALGMVLAFEALAGGYLLGVETQIEAGAALQKAKYTAFKKGAGKTYEDMQKARAACVKWAAEAWALTPTIRMKAMTESLEKRLYESMADLPTLDLPPKATTIRDWLKEAAAQGEVRIPPAAQKPGANPRQR